MKRAILTAAMLLALPVGIAAQSAPDLVVVGPNVSDTSLEDGVPLTVEGGGSGVSLG